MKHDEPVLGIATFFFSARQLRAFGAISVQWADVEETLGNLVGLYVGCPREIEDLVSNRLAREASRRIDILRDFSKATLKECSPEQKRLKWLLDISDALRVKRNSILHSVWLAIEEGRISGIDMKGGVRSRVETNLEELERLAINIASLATALSNFTIEKRRARAPSPETPE